MFKSLFGKSQDQAWRELADEIGGEDLKGGLTRSAKIVQPYQEWLLVLDTFAVSNGEPPDVDLREL